MSASQQKRNKELHAQIASLETRLAGVREELKSARAEALEEAAGFICYESDAAMALGNTEVVEALMRVRETIRALAKGSK